MKKLKTGVKMKLITTLIMLSVMSLPSFAELTSKLEHFIVKKGPDGKEILKSASRVFPGEIVHYKLTYVNTEDEVLNNVDIAGMIPAQTNYVDDSATNEIKNIIMYSIDDGENWSQKPMKTIMINGKPTKIAAETFEYTNIKWKVDLFDKRETKVFEYRVMVKN